MVKKFKEFFNEGEHDPIMGAPGEDALPDIPEEEDIPAIFATIHFKSEHRPDGYEPEEIAEINRKLAEKKNG